MRSFPGTVLGGTPQTPDSSNTGANCRPWPRSSLGGSFVSFPIECCAVWRGSRLSCPIPDRNWELLELVLAGHCGPLAVCGSFPYRVVGGGEFPALLWGSQWVQPVACSHPLPVAKRPSKALQRSLECKYLRDRSRSPSFLITSLAGLSRAMSGQARKPLGG